MTVSVDPVRVYLNQIGKMALLTASEEVELAKQIEVGLYATWRLSALTDAIDSAHQPNEDKSTASKAGRRVPPGLCRDLHRIVREGQRAKNQLLEANLRLVVSIAKRYTGWGMPFLDLIQEGNLGLVHAVEKFDYTKGNKFSTYATWWIRQAITRAMTDQARTIRLPRNIADNVRKLDRVGRELLVDLGREPTAQELAEEMGLTPRQVLQLRRYARPPVSLDQTVGEQGDTRLGELIEDSDAMVAVEAVSFVLLQGQLRNLLTTLPEREADMIRLRFGLTDGRPRTLDEISRHYGLNRESIRQLEAKTMSKLRHPCQAPALRAYLD